MEAWNQGFVNEPLPLPPTLTFNIADTWHLAFAPLNLTPSMTLVLPLPGRYLK